MACVATIICSVVLLIVRWTDRLGHSEDKANETVLVQRELDQSGSRLRECLALGKARFFEVLGYEKMVKKHTDFYRAYITPKRLVLRSDSCYAANYFAE